MDFKRLENFLSIAETGSLSRAADRMRVAQPALSRQMRILEEELGVKLFARHRRGMQLTEAGEELRGGIVKPMRQIEQICEDIRSLSKTVGGRIALGMPPTASYVLAGSLSRSVARYAPNISLHIVEGYSSHLVDWLQRGEIDVALLYGPATDFELNALELLTEEMSLVGPSTSDLDPGTPVPLASLANLPLVLPSHPNGLRILAENAAAKAGVRLEIKFQADSLHLMKDLAESGLGYTILPQSAFTHEVATGRLRHAPLIEPRVARQLVMATQPGERTPRAARTLDTLVRSEIAALVGSGRWAANLMFDPGDYPIRPDD